MKETINLRFDSETIAAIKAFAKKHNTSVSMLAEKYFKSLTQPNKAHYLAEELEGCLQKYSHYTDDDIRDEYLKSKHDV